MLSCRERGPIREAAANLNGPRLAASAPPAAEPVAKEEEQCPINTIDMHGQQLAKSTAADVLARAGTVAKTAMSPEEQARDTAP